MKDNSKILAAFLIGAAVGGAVAWFLTSDNKEELLDDIKDMTGKLKDDLKETVEKGKKIVDNIKEKAEGYLSEQ